MRYKGMQKLPFAARSYRGGGLSLRYSDLSLSGGSISYNANPSRSSDHKCPSGTLSTAQAHLYFRATEGLSNSRFYSEVYS